MSVNKLIQFINCRLVRNHELIEEDLWVRSGKIINPEPIFFDEQKEADVCIDCKGAIIAPGYIDIQINGGFGVDFSYDTGSVAQGIEKVASGILSHGVTSFCPTLVTSPAATYCDVLPKIPIKTNGANVLGWHLEGPFINTEKKGAHVEQSILNLEQGVENLMQTYNSLEHVKIVTLAPEKDKTGAVIKYLSDKGIVVGLGHSVGHLCDGERAAQNGAKLITHLFNAMSQFHHRDPGLFGLIASSVVPADKCIYFSIIADNVHTHPAALRIAHRTHPDGLILVTDAISALGLEEGVHHIGQLKLEVREGSGFIAGTETLCGSIAPLDACVRNFKAATDCSVVSAIDTVTLHPAKCLNMENQIGTLNFGANADLVMLDDELNVQSTWIKGNLCYGRVGCGCF